jgi:predicted dienelactone hydrolase
MRLFTALSDMSIRLAMALVSALWCTTGIATAQDAPDPTSPGPYAVGVTERIFTRPSSSTGEARSLPTYIWYPAAVAAAGRAPHTFLHAPVNVAPERVGAPYPVVLWSHGNGGVPWEATYLTTLLASHGFVVVAPAHVGNTAETCPQPCVDAYPPARSARDEARANRPDDLIAAFDQSLQLSNGEDPLLAGLLDPARVGAAGESFGSQTALRVLGLDSRFRAGVAMAGGAVPPLLAAVPMIHVPTMLMGAGLDDMEPFADQETVFAAFPDSGPERWLVALPHAGHFAFQDLCPAGWGGCAPSDLPQAQAHALVNRWAIAFLLRYAAGDERYTSLLDPSLAVGAAEVQVTHVQAPVANAAPE